MLKKTAIASLALALMIFIGVSSFGPPDPNPESNRCCPPGWEIWEFLETSTNPNLIKDLNGDYVMCYKDLPGKKANGNNLGRVDARNWKDNNQPCDD